MPNPSPQTALRIPESPAVLHTRDSAESYARYFAGMERSAQEKIARSTAHFPPSGAIILDTGFGSGMTSDHLAALYPENRIIGIDIDPASVAHAADLYRRGNLTFIQGDATIADFPPESFDGIFECSCGHHLTSFGEPRFALTNLLKLRDAQIAQLKTGGMLVVRDFVVPRGPAEVLLEIPANDGMDAGVIQELSTAALFEEFARTFRSSQHLETGISYQEVEASQEGCKRYRVSLRDATEFLLRKDYREDWDKELREEYLYLSQAEHEQAFRDRGLRVLASGEYLNPWIASNRFEGKARLFNPEGKPLPFPPTNYVIVGEKVAPDAGVTLRAENTESTPHPLFVTLERYREKSSGKVFDVVRRPNQTVDVIPWFNAKDGGLWILARQGYPRPITQVQQGEALDGAHLAGYITEPISATVSADENRSAAIKRIAEERAAIDPETIRSIGDGFRFLPSPGSVDEQIDSVLVEIEPPVKLSSSIKNHSNLSTSGNVRALEANQTLRAYQVGGMYDARLEIGIYRLLLEKRLPLGPWIGAAVSLTPQATPAVVDDVRELFDRIPQQEFTLIKSDLAPRFLDLRKGSFEELSSSGNRIAKIDLEYVTPKNYSDNTIVVVPLRKDSSGALYIGLEVRNLPAAQLRTGDSTVVTVPAFRLPLDVTNPDQAKALVKMRMHQDFGVSLSELTPLGGKYFPSPGVIPEVVLPYAADVKDDGTLRWVRLDELLAERGRINDAHLLTAVFRAGHACGAP